MKQLTHNDLAKILQLDQSYQEKLRVEFPNYDEEQKVEILSTLWKGFRELKEKMARVIYEGLLEEVGAGKRELTDDLFDQAQRIVWQEIENIVSGKSSDLDQIQSVRDILHRSLHTSLPQVKSNS